MPKGHRQRMPDDAWPRPGFDCSGFLEILQPEGSQVQQHGRKWALLAYLILERRKATRSSLASLLFADADDPLGALRWNLSELRRALGPEIELTGDPLTLVLPENWHCDAESILGPPASGLVDPSAVEGELLSWRRLGAAGPVVSGLPGVPPAPRGICSRSARR